MQQFSTRELSEVKRRTSGKKTELRRFIQAATLNTHENL
jgi:hypothetical protein